MKLKISESFPGELTGDPDFLVQKATEALRAALEQAGVTKCGCSTFAKGSGYRKRGGELQLIDDLAEGMADLYRKRLEKLQADLVKRAGSLSE